MLSEVVIDIQGDNNEIIIENNSILRNVQFHIRGNHHKVHIGESCRFTRGSLIWMEDNKCSLRIGSCSTFEEVHFALTEDGSSITIGSDCMMANDIDIRTGDSHPIFDLDSQRRINPAQDVSIADHVWIGAHANILKGVSISKDTIVATGSILTKKFDEHNVILAGNPAKITRAGITWARNRHDPFPNE